MPNSLEGVLANIPGLGGYLASQQFNQQQALGQLQQMGVLSQVAARQQQIALEQQKMAKDAAMQKMLSDAIGGGMGGGSNIDPDTLEKVGLLTGKPEFIARAKDMRKALSDKTTLETMKGAEPEPSNVPGAITGVVPTEAAGIAAYEANKGKPFTMTVDPKGGGLFAGLMQSPVPQIASEARTLASQLNKSDSRSISPQHWIDAQRALAAREATLIASKDAQADRNANRPDQPVTAIQFKDPSSSTGWSYKDGRTGKIISTDAPPPAGSSEKAVVHEATKELSANYSRLRDAPQQIANIEKAKALVPDAKTFQGSLGEQKLAIAKFFNNNLGTKIDLTGVQTSEELRSRIFFNVMDNLKKMDAQPSQLQQQIMQDALGKLGTDPQALPRVLDAFSEAIRTKVGLYQKQVDEAKTLGINWPHKIELPNSGAPSPAKAEASKTRIRFDAQGNVIQ